MTASFFDRPILNSPYQAPGHHWEFVADGQPTNRIIDARRRSDLITPVPKPKKRRQNKRQGAFNLGAEDVFTDEQEYNPTPIINEVRSYVEAWRNLPSKDQWLVTPETQRLLTHWRHHPFHGVRPFFCKIEAVETAIWLAEVAPKLGTRTDFIVQVNDGHTDPLNLIFEVKGFRAEDAKDEANTMRAYWVPGVNNLDRYGRWAFVEFTAVYEIDRELGRLLDGFLASEAA